MKHQQVLVDYWKMLKTSGLFLLLAFSGYILMKMVQTIFWLPRYLERNQKRLEELAESYAINLREQSTDTVKEPLPGEHKEEAPLTDPEVKKDK